MAGIVTRDRLNADPLAQATASLRATANRLQVLTRHGEQLAAERDPARILEVLCRSAREVIGSGASVLYAPACEPEGHALFVSGLHGAALQADMIGSSGTPLAPLLKQAGTVRLWQTSQAPGELGLPRAHPPVRSLLAASVASPQRVYGWICLTDKLGPDSFCETDEELLETMARLTGRIYENAIQYSAVTARTAVLEAEIVERRDAERELERRLRYEHVVASVSTKLSELSLNDVDEGVQRVLAEVAEFIGTDRIVIFVVDDDNSEVLERHRWFRPGCEPRDPPDRTYPLGTWTRERLVRDALVTIDSVEDLPPEAADEQAILKRLGVHSCMAVGLKPSGDYRGFALATAVRSPRRWSPDEQALFRLLGEILGHFFERRRAAQEQARLYAELEERVRVRTRELEAANAELESFAYTVSHDLRSPLRTINGFARLLSSDYAAGLDRTGREYLEGVIGGTVRMSALLEGLQRLSHVTLAPVQWKEVDLRVLAKEAVAELRRQSPERDVEVVLPEELRVRGDVSLLRNLVANLIGNAWKYSARTPHARIELGVQERDGTREYFVRDNGVGFEEAHAGKLFTAFHRLHHVGDFEGTGIGLATVARIVRRHGGSVRGEGEAGVGATFYFTLGESPSAQQDPRSDAR